MTIGSFQPKVSPSVVNYFDILAQTPLTILTASEKKKLRERYSLNKAKQMNELILETVQIVGVGSDLSKAKIVKEQQRESQDYTSKQK